MRELVIKDLSGIFGSFKTEDVAKAVIDRIDETHIAEGESLEDAIREALDAEMIYDDDRWAVIANYSDPDSPLTYAEAEEPFFDDLLQCVEAQEMGD